MNYASSLVSNFGKVYQLPPYKSSAYNMLLKDVNDLLHSYNSSNRVEIFNRLYTLIGPLKPLPESSSSRATERISHIVEMLAEKNFIPQNILDIGAGSGDISTALMKHYGLSKDQVFAIDQKLPSVLEITPLTYINDNIPLADNSMDVIIIFNVLHHVPPQYRPHLINEAVRVLRPGGYCIIREHDDDKDPLFTAYIDLIHMFWYIAKHETEDPLYLMSKEEMHNAFIQAGLTSVGFHTYPGNNPQHLYHEMFTKILVGESKTPLKQGQFQDEEVRTYLQAIINRIKETPRESLLTVIPLPLHQKLGTADINTITKEVALYLITTAPNYVTPINGIYYITIPSLVAAFEAQ